MTISIFLAVCSLAAQAGSPPSSTEKAIDFNREIRPILSNKCFACHGPDEKVRKADLRLDTPEGIFADRGGYFAVVKGKPEESDLVRRINAKQPNKAMPPRKSGKTLSPADIDLLARWVKQGAPFTRHWAYIPPSRPSLPPVKDTSWPRNPIDHFILTRLEAEGLKPAPEADRPTLIRRLALDLTGLPPTQAEVEAFLKDSRPNALEELVDRLLAKEAYGEHWARMWLDLARYGDSAGYADDPLRTIWAFRDYVLRSFNANKPFDQFTIEQLAGDLLPNPTEEQLVATAFHRNTMTNNEGGTNDEEFRNVAVVDRVNTTMTVWMGTSMACAQCHNHKYDPLSQKEYFQLFAFLNNTEDSDRGDEQPVLTLREGPHQALRARLEAEISGLEKELKSKKPNEGKAERERLAGLKKQLAGLKPATVPIMRDLTGNQRRKTRIQFRGNYLDLGEEVSEGLPAVFPPLPPGAPRNRLGLVRWLVDPKNPLTARVLANRYWEQIFGIGLVRTSEEFGIQGEPPTHPELLDWLAVEMVQHHWDLKYFLKLLVTSAAYRQSSRVIPALLERDPENRWLSRGPRVRLSAEMVRDQALFVSGLLSPKMYGPSVRPAQPSFGLSAAFGSSVDWRTSEGEDRHRRGLYTEWRRTNPYPSLVTFDAPTREVCTVRRNRTNTPLQALVTLNDPVFLEAAQALARNMVQAGSDPASRVRRGFQRCLIRPPTDRELTRLVRLYEDTRADFLKNPTRAVPLATNPLGPLPAGLDAQELASWTVVANVLLNLDEMFLKR